MNNNTKNISGKNYRSRKNSYKRIKKARSLKYGFILLSTIFILLIGLSTFSLKANAKDSSHAADYKYYDSYCISKGDTIWDIAEKNIDYNHYSSVKEYVKEIEKINNINGSYIKKGTYIMIPLYTNNSNI